MILLLLQIFEQSLEQAKLTFEKIMTLLNNAFAYNQESLISVYLLGGMLLEDASLEDAEQQYAIALLLCNKAYGDPRGRGCRGRPVQLFLAWRLSMLTRLQDKLIDAEFAEEIYDCALLGLGKHEMNAFASQYEEQELWLFSDRVN